MRVRERILPSKLDTINYRATQTKSGLKTRRPDFARGYTRQVMQLDRAKSDPIAIKEHH